jgi:serine/threonine protein kinase/tetratricopeptide (TPR) repeat protein
MTEPQPVPGSGEHIGPYRIVGILARGGMGEVYLAQDDLLNRQVAIKRIRHDSGVTPILRQRLLREAQALVHLDHPAIVRVYHLQKHEGDDCIVMEYVEGPTLAEALKAGPLEPGLAVRLAKTVASGLAAAHAAGIIHRDLKTENVMVTPSGGPKILDFGLAKPIGIASDDPSLTAAGHVVGTCRSMSPEQARGEEVDERSDLFSLGVLLYEMLAGISPFQGSNWLATVSKVISERPPCLDTLRPGLPPRLVALIYRLLAKDPADRPQSATEAVRELHEIAASLGVSGDLDPEQTVSALPTDTIRRWGGDPTPPLPMLQPVPAPLPESPPQPRRRRVLIAVLSFLMALAVGVILWMFWKPKPPAPKLSPIHQKPLWVLVLNPPGADHDAQFQHAASALVKASLSTLGNLQGIIPIGPVVDLPKDTTKITATEDFLTVTLDPSGNWGYVKLSRIHGKVLTYVTLTAAIDPQHLQELKSQVEAKLPELFPLIPPRVDVGKGDYTAFVEIEHQIEEGQVSLESVRQELDQIIETSPNFMEARLLEADILVMLYKKSQNERDRQRALELIREAEGLAAPDDPRPLQSKFRLALAKPQGDDAEAILSKLKKLNLGNPQIPVLEANLADKKGGLADALYHWREAAEDVPYWGYLLKLAQIEEGLGLATDARSHLEQILRSMPDNPYALRRLAELELDFGNAASAEKIYLGLIKGSPTCEYYSNLGIARDLLGHHSDAIDAFQEALKLEPENVAVKLNLAETRLALGDKKTGDILYKEACRIPASDETIEAQCLAHFGDPQKANELVRRALEKNPDNPDIIRSAALVYTLTGDHKDALETIRNAIAEHLGPNWFKLPYFSPLFKESKFHQILNSAAHSDRDGSLPE